MSARPQDVVDQLLELSGGEALALVREHHEANLRWAGSSLTTNGASHTRAVTVVRVLRDGDTARAGVASGTGTTPDDLRSLVEAAGRAARGSTPADDAAELVEGAAAPDWDAAPETTGPEAFAEFAPALGRAFGTARAGGRRLYGYAEHDVTTSYLGSTTGLRLRHAQPGGRAELTGKADGGARSSWVGRHTRDFRDVDPEALADELATRLEWARHRVELPAGRYEVVLPPGAVADLVVWAYWAMSAREAAEGSTAYSRPGGGTRVGERLAGLPLTLRSDPAFPGLECAPFVVATASGPASSVFDNGLPLGATDWLRDGQLRALMTTRASARRTGLAVTPSVDNLVLEAPGGTGATEDLVARTEHGLLLTCVWYVREVDPETMLVTGLTRDGVYLVEDGRVRGQVTNFRFNESPLEVLRRATEASATVPVLCREWADYFRRAAMPALRVPAFNMSTVSDAS